MMVLEMYLFSTMAILGIHVSVRGDIYSGMIRLFLFTDLNIASF